MAHGPAYDWLIVGGGLQGSFAARAIADVAPDARVAILSERSALAAWQQRAQACGMTYLRSSNAHHLGQRAGSLRHFAAVHDFDETHWLGHYGRPSRALFENHTHEALGGPTRLHARATEIEQLAGRWRVHTTQGAHHDTARLVLALGPNAPYRPPWATDCAHVYDPLFDIQALAGRRIAVVGGGITGAQLALQLQAAGRSVCWVTRTTPRRADFDSEPCYAGPRCLVPFQRTPIEARTALLAQARRPGTLPPDVFARITAALAAGEIAWQCGTIKDGDTHGLRFADGRRLSADQVVVATGFDSAPPVDGLLDRCIRGFGLRCDRDGHIFMNTDLETVPGLHILGRAASLQLGPMAANLKGARLGGTRLAALAGRVEQGHSA